MRFLILFLEKKTVECKSFIPSLDRETLDRVSRRDLHNYCVWKCTVCVLVSVWPKKFLVCLDKRGESRKLDLLMYEQGIKVAGLGLSYKDTRLFRYLILLQ